MWSTAFLATIPSPIRRKCRSFGSTWVSDYVPIWSHFKDWVAPLFCRAIAGRDPEPQAELRADASFHQKRDPFSLRARRFLGGHHAGLSCCTTDRELRAYAEVAGLR